MQLPQRLGRRQLTHADSTLPAWYSHYPGGYNNFVRVCDNSTQSMVIGHRVCLELISMEITYTITFTHACRYSLNIRTRMAYGHLLVLLRVLEKTLELSFGVCIFLVGIY